MRLALREEMQEIDRRATLDFGLSPEQLMEQAGAKMAQEILALPGLGPDRRIGVFCGPGNNGGDGLVVARKLIEAGFSQTEIWHLESTQTSMLFELNLRRFKELNGSVRTLNDSNFRKFEFNRFDLLIDAFYGTGLNRDLDPSLCRFIERINQQKVSVISLDVPTGLDVNRGVTWGAGLRAVKTLTCGLAKPGFYLQQGPALVGAVKILDIGFPKSLLESIANSTFLIGQRSAQKLLPRRKSTANKSNYGKLLLIAGGPGMEGAALLSAQAAARMGVGYVCVASPSKDLFLKMPPDFLRIDWAHILTMDLSPFSAVAIGPGLGMGSQTLQLLLRFKAENLKNVLVDADALTVAAKHKIWPLPESWVLTPHAGELSRILPLTAAQIEADRLKAVADASQVTGAQVLLKGFRSVLRSGQKSYLINSGNVALAKAGTGDVLTGFISSLMAQGLPSAQAAVLGAYLHGRIADRWVGRGHSSRTLLASDLPNLLPKLMNQVLREIK